MAPRCYGGDDSEGNLIDICEHCHSLVHKCANLAIKGKSPNDIIVAVFPNNFEGQRNLTKLAQVIVDAYSGNAKNADESGHKESQTVIFKLPYEFYHLDVKQAAAGMKLPIYAFIEAAIREKVFKVNGVASLISSEPIAVAHRRKSL